MTSTSELLASCWRGSDSPARQYEGSKGKGQDSYSSMQHRLGL